MRYNTVFLDVDGTLLWMDVDVEGYAEDLSPYASEPLSAERAAGPVWGSVKRHISENINYPTEKELAAFRESNAREVARELGVAAPEEVLAHVAERRISFNPYPESERVMRELRVMGLAIYVVSNWDVLLEEILEKMGWMEYFDGIVVSGLVGVEKPERGIFEEALRVSGTERERAIHVGNDPISDVRGASGAGIDAAFVNRAGHDEAPEAAFTLPDLNRLPELLAKDRA